jgi:acetoin utilization protein AcuB
MSSTRIADLMTSHPHTIGQEQTLAAAHLLMRTHRIRHLPVLEGGRLVGLLSLRDLYFVEALDGLRPDQILVADAMSPDPYTATPDELVTKVADDMAVHTHGAAVVVERGKVVGVFTTTDALRGLAEVCRKADQEGGGKRRRAS